MWDETINWKKIFDSIPDFISYLEMKRSFVYSDEEHAGLATRAPVPPETPAGDDRLDADDQSRPRPDPRAEDDFLVEEVEEVVISQPGQEFQYFNIPVQAVEKFPVKGRRSR